MTYEPGRVADLLGPDGPGSAHLEGSIDPGLLRALQTDVTSDAVTWLEQTQTVTTNDGRTIKQGFDYFAHKLSAGDQSALRHLQSLPIFSHFVSAELVEPLTAYFPSLQAWWPDEITVQRYTAGGDNLDFHFDQRRYSGLVVIANTIGTAILNTIDGRSFEEEPYTMNEGDVLLLRSTNLYPTTDSRDLRTEHAVGITSEGRVSVGVRANTRPTEHVEGFDFHNWPQSGISS